jgi:hypothetical protein
MVDHVYETERPAVLMQRFQRETTPEGLLQTAAWVNSVYVPRIYDWARIVYSTRIQDPAADAAWTYRVRQRKAIASGIVSRLKASGRLAQDWTEVDARDVVFMLLSLHTYESLIEGGDRSRTGYRLLLGRLLERALLDDRPANQRPPSSS